MVTESRVPDDPIKFIQDCVRRRDILWSYHVNMRLDQRSIARNSIVQAAETYELVEAYPHDKYLPSYLVVASHGEDVFHVLFGVDMEDGNVRVVTAYRPDPDKWSQNWKKRR